MSCVTIAGLLTQLKAEFGPLWSTFIISPPSVTESKKVTNKFMLAAGSSVKTAETSKSSSKKRGKQREQVHWVRKHDFLLN